MDVILTDDISARSYFDYLCLQNLFKYVGDVSRRNIGQVLLG